MRFVQHTCLWILLAGPGVPGCGSQETIRRQSTELSNRVGSPEPIDRLPSHVQSPDRRLTLFADFGDTHEDSVVLYLVNRTDLRIGFSARYGDPYVKLESLAASGQWERAQGHVNSLSCGNAFGIQSLGPGEFFRFLGYHPEEGEAGTVRYHVYRDSAYIFEDDTPQNAYAFFWRDPAKMPLNLVSNAGPGRYRMSDILEARHDALALRYGGFDAIREMAMGSVTYPRPVPWGRSTAVYFLRRFPNQKTVKVLAALLEDDDLYVRQAAIGIRTR